MAHAHRTRPRTIAVAGALASGVTTVSGALLVDLQHQVDAVHDAQGAIVALCTAALLVAVTWVGLAGLTVVAEAWRWVPGTDGPRSRAVPAVVRRAVLACCGIALIGTTSLATSLAPARAEVDAFARIDGLPLPTRTSDAVTSGRHWPAPAHAPADDTPALPGATSSDPAVRHTVTAGESLWDIAGELHPAGATPDEIARTANLLWRSNQSVIGANPDLILPGQVLKLPPPHSDATPSEGPS
jgi:LysM repeat protein